MALAACGTRESVEPLLGALEDEDPLVSQAAVMALENLTGYAEPLVEPRRDTETSGAGSLSANARVGKPPVAPNQSSVHQGFENSFGSRAMRRVEAERWRAWVESHPWKEIEAELVARLASGDRDQQRRAAVTLGHMGGDAAKAALRAYVAKERDNNPYPEWRKNHRGDGTKFNSLADVNPRTLQAVTRALGYLEDRGAVGLLSETLGKHSQPESGNLFLAEAAVESLGRIGTPEAEEALVGAMANLKDYFYYVGWYGDHPALFACHTSPVHYLITEALDARGSTQAKSIVPHLIRSVPTDVDRALFAANDDCETLIGRVIRRAGCEAAVVETCLSILGDAQGVRTPEIEEAIGTTYQAWGGETGPGESGGSYFVVGVP